MITLYYKKVLYKRLILLIGKVYDIDQTLKLYNLYLNVSPEV